MAMLDPIVIVGAARTAMGGFQGDLKDATAPQLGAAAIRAALARSEVSAEAVEEVVFGCVLPAGQGQAPARQATIGAGLPFATGASTVNKMCGSGMKAVMLAHDLIAAGSANMTKSSLARSEIVVVRGSRASHQALAWAPPAMVRTLSSLSPDTVTL